MFPYTAAKYTIVTDDPHFFKSKTKAAVYSKKFMTLEEGLVRVQKKILNYGNWHYAMIDWW